MTTNKRNCYCSLWEKNPDVLIDQGVKPGFCGICGICKNQGHLRHAPGCHPYSAAWCDNCYKVQALINTTQCLCFPALLVALVNGFYFLAGVAVFVFFGIVAINKNGQKLIKKLAGK